MRIAFITFEYPPSIIGGAGVYAKNLVDALSKNHEITVITPNFYKMPGFSFENGITIIRLPIINVPFFCYFSFLFSLIFFFFKFTKSHKMFDIIHSNGISDFSLINLYNNTPRVIMIHSLSQGIIKAENPNFFKRIFEKGENNYISGYIEKRVLTSSNFIIANSNYMKNEMINNYNINPKKIIVIYPGVKIPISQKNHDISNFGEINLEKKCFKLLFIGRLIKRKGLHFLLDAIKKLVDAELKNIKLIVIGTGPEYHNSLKLIRKLHIEDYVVFLGYQSDEAVSVWYKKCDLVVIPSLNEPFGIVVLEAMLAKKPIVTSNCGAFPELIENNINGFLVNPINSSLIAEAIKKIMDDKKMRTIMGENNFNKVINNFTWEKNAFETCKIYHSLVNTEY